MIREELLQWCCERLLMEMHFFWNESLGRLGQLTHVLYLTYFTLTLAVVCVGSIHLHHVFENSNT